MAKLVATTYCPCRRRRTISRVPRGHSHPLAAQAWAAASTVAPTAVFHDIPVVVVHGHSWRVEATQLPFCCPVSSRTGCRSACRCMRLAGVCYHIHHLLRRVPHRRHSAHLDGCRISGRWERAGEVCCSPDALNLCAVGVRLQVRFATSWQQPGLRQSCMHVDNV